MLCEQRLKEQGVLASFINIDEYILDLIPYDGDLLSMEYESAFRVCSGCRVQIYIINLLWWNLSYTHKLLPFVSLRSATWKMTKQVCTTQPKAS